MTTSMRRFLRLPRVVEATGLKKSQIQDAIKRGIFPSPVKILEGGRASAWVEDEIAAYNEARIAARDAAQTPTEPRRESTPQQRRQQRRTEDSRHGN